MCQHTVDNEIDFAFLDTEVAQKSVQVVGRHVDVPQQEAIFQTFAFYIVLAEFTPIVEEDANDDAFYLDVVGIRINGIDSFKEVEHLIGVVEQSSRECVVHAGGSRIFAVGCEERVGLLTDEADKGLIGAVAEELLDAAIPFLTLDGAWHEVVERVLLGGEGAYNHVHVGGRLLSLVITNGDEGDELSHFGTARFGYVEHADGFVALSVGNLEIDIG